LLAQSNNVLIVQSKNVLISRLYSEEEYDQWRIELA